jgi:hypothetical protein
MLPSLPEISSRIHHLPFFGRLACHPTPAVSLMPPPILLGAGSSSGMLTCCPALFSAFAAFPTFHWEFSAESLAPSPTPILRGRFSVSPPSLLLVLDYHLLFIFFSFAGEGGFSLFRSCTGLFSWGVGERVTCGTWSSPVSSAVSHKQLWSQLVGRNGTLFSVLCSIGRLSMGKGSRMLQSLILIDALSSACWENKKPKNREENH